MHNTSPETIYINALYALDPISFKKSFIVPPSGCDAIFDTEGGVMTRKVLEVLYN